MKFCRWRKKLTKDCKRAADDWLLIASVSTVINIIDFLCILGNIELQMSIRTLIFQLIVFGVCMGITISCVALARANEYKAVRIKECDFKATYEKR